MTDGKRIGRRSLTCLGVGDGWASEGRNHSAFVHQLGDTRLLIDCGEPVGRSLKAAGFGPDDLDAVLISHLHFDHVGGLFMLLQGFWLEPRSRPLTVYLPGEGLDPIRQMLAAGYIFPELLDFELRLAPLQAGVALEIGELRVIPRGNTHLESLRRQFQATHPRPFESFSFLLESPFGRVAHSADLGQVADLAVLLQEPLDLLVCELAHLAPGEVFERLRDAQVSRVVFNHLSRPQWLERERLAAEATRTLAGRRVQFVQDGDVVDW